MRERRHEFVCSAEEVRCWTFGLDPPEGVVEALGGVLTEEERARADRFATVSLRARFVVARGVLRAVLGRLTGRAPGEVAFRHGPHGKPGLEASGWEFNLSHSGERGVVAVAVGRRVGVDVERVRPIEDAAGLVARFFSPAERAAFEGLADERKLDAFYRVWTRKEAYMKATGEGFALPLGRFSVAVDEPRLVSREGDEAEAGRWSMRDLDVGPDYRGAVAAEGSGWRLVVGTIAPAGLLGG